MEKRVVAVGDKGARVGEDHGRARLTNHEVDLIRRLHAEGVRCVDLAEKFETTKSTINDIVKGRRRVGIVVGWRTVVLG